MTQNCFFGCETSKFRRRSHVNRFILDILCRLLLLLSKRFRWSKDEIQLRKLHSHLWNCSIHQWWVDLIYRLRRSVTKIWKFKVWRPKKFDRWRILCDYVKKLGTTQVNKFFADQCVHLNDVSTATGLSVEMREILKTLHVKFFPSGSLLPNGPVAVQFHCPHKYGPFF